MEGPRPGGKCEPRRKMMQSGVKPAEWPTTTKKTRILPRKSGPSLRKPKARTTHPTLKEEAAEYGLFHHRRKATRRPWRRTWTGNPSEEHANRTGSVFRPGLAT